MLGFLRLHRNCTDMQKNCAKNCAERCLNAIGFPSKCAEMEMEMEMEMVTEMKMEMVRVMEMELCVVCAWIS